MNIKIFNLQIISVVMICLFPVQLYAEQWKIVPSIAVETKYDDNLRLSTDSHSDVTGAIVKGNLALSRITETGEISAKVFANSTNYSGDNTIDKNENNVFFLFNAKENTERALLKLDGSYKQDTINRSYDIIDDDVIDDDVDAGIVEIDVKRAIAKIRPSWQYNLTEKSRINLAYNYENGRFKNNPIDSGLYDYDKNGLNLFYDYRLSERDVFNTSVAYSRFEAEENNNNQVDTYELTAGYQRVFSETLFGNINLGVSRSKQESNVSQSDNNGFIVRLNLEHLTELDKYVLSLNHDIQPSGNGSVTEITRASLRMTHKFSTRLIGTLISQAYRRDSIEETNSTRRYYLNIRPKLSWKLSEWWTLAGGLNYRRVHRDSNNGDAESNAVFLSIAYSKPITSD